MYTTMWRKSLILMFLLSTISLLIIITVSTNRVSAKIPEPVPSKVVSIAPEGDKINIYVSSLDGSQQTKVASIAMEFNHPLFGDLLSLSPDGTQVLYVTADNTALLDAEFWIAQADGSGARSIAQFPEGLWTAPPVWSPSGKQIAYVIKQPDSEPDEGLQLWVMNWDGQEQTLITEGEDFRPALFERIPEGVVRWQEDGSGLEFIDRWSSVPFLYTVDIQTRVVTREETAKDPSVMQQLDPQGSAALPCAVPVFNQNSYSDNMRTCNLTIAWAGCALTSTAMVFKYYGVNTTPPTLNSCLGNQACPMDWEPASSRCSENKVSWIARPSFDYNVLSQDLAAGKPVIVWVDKPNDSNATHFVVVTGGSGSSPAGYTINDPANGSSNKTLANYTNAGWRLQSMRRYSGTPQCSSGDADGGSIAYGQTKNGTINPANDFDDFYFNGTAGDIVEIRQNKASGSSLDSFMQLRGPNGYSAEDDDGGGNYNSFLRRTLPTTGQYTIRAKAYGSSTGAYTVNLIKVTSGGCGGDCEGDPRWIAFNQTLNGTINPNSDRDTYYFTGTAGRIVSIHMNKISSGLDPYLELWSPGGSLLRVNDDGGGNQNAWLVYTLPSNGAYRIVARSFNGASSGSYSIKLESTTSVSSGNLARGKPVNVSSVEFSGVEGWKATDGNMSTRWSSRFSNPQHIYVDFGQNRTFNQVVLKWESAYGKSFGIYYWTGSQWQNIYWTNNGHGGTNTINFSQKTARYVMMYGTQRGTPWGYSLWEFEVYDTTSATMPDVPPDDPEKIDNVESDVPLSPVDGDKDVLLSGDGEYGQEEMPLANPEDAEDISQQVNETQSIIAFINSPSELDGLFTPSGYLRFEGIASSQVNGEDIPISAYGWRSDRAGELGAESLFTLPVTSLTPGTHTIYFKAQNANGVWSEEVSTTLTVEWPYQVYLPLTVR